MENKERFEGLFGDVDKLLLEKFWEFHRKNPLIYEAFKRFSNEAFNAGRERFSHWMVVNRIRWYTTIETKGSEFKVSNDFIALYGRLLVYQYPKFEGFFKFKRMKSRRRYYSDEDTYNFIQRMRLTEEGQQLELSL